MNTDKNEKQNKKPKPVEILSLRRENVLLETTYDPAKIATQFYVKQGNKITTQPSITLGNTKYKPISGSSELLANKVVMLPSECPEHIEVNQLYNEVRDFIHQYVAVSPEFEIIAAHYVLLSWVYDYGQEVPYLRLMGSPGSGKTRFLQVLGSICYKSTFAGGSTTAAPIMRMADKIRGTFIIDEANFSFSDMTAVITQILNQGYSRGFPILRMEGANGVFNPKSFCVFGPKIIATRERFADDALESRCITEVMNGLGERAEISLSLNKKFRKESLELRNKLLSYRMNFSATTPIQMLQMDSNIHPRMRQIFLPLLRVSPSLGHQTQLLNSARTHHYKLLDIIRDSIEYDVLLAILKLSETEEKPSLAQIYRLSGFDGSPRALGEIIRKKLRCKTVRLGSGYIVPTRENKNALLDAQKRFHLQSKSERNEGDELPEVKNV